MKIDVYHDIACPWCRIGKANLETALTEWAGEPVTVNWQPFLLDRDVPAAGVPVTDFYQAKFGAENLDSMFDRVKAAGRNVGVEFDFASGVRAPSQDAHRLIWLAPDDAKRAVLEGLHRAYFNEGKNVADLAVLADIAAAAGMDRAETLARLQSDEGKAETAAEIAQAQAMGVSGVPFFVFDDTYALSGAQPPATLLSAMQQTVAARQQA
ncbi:MAG: DsbA family oxidoreductase [Thermomicrobiales bacterium]|nr:DsbA family oxidoreductase [Thermomicrobiales bacterium]